MKFTTTNSREYIKTGEHVIIKKDGEYYCRFAFCDYDTEKECIEAAEKLCKLLNLAQSI